MTVAAGVVALVAGLIALAAAGVFSGRARSHAATRSNRPAPAATTGAAAPTTSPLQLPTTTLKPGEQGAQVRRLQRALARLGYPPGKIDGQYGSATTQALANFQRANKLTADGILGPATLAALTRSLKNRS